MIAEALLACAIGVHPATLERIIAVESGGNPYAIHINHWIGLQPHPINAAHAEAIATAFIAAGYSVDIGAMQVNSRHGYPVADMLDPCKNLAAGSSILSSFYAAAVQQYGEGQPALVAAISAYNTGDFAKGVRNGYVARVAGIPDIPLSDMSAPAPTMQHVHLVAATGRHNSDMDVW